MERIALPMATAHVKARVPVAAACNAGDSGAIIALLQAILAELRVLRADLRRQRVTTPTADRLVQAVYGLLGSEAFTAAQLIALADSPLSTRLELRSVVEDIVRGDIDQAGAGRMFGRFLARNSQHAVDGVQLVSLGKTREGFAYRVDVATKTRKAWNWADQL
jgi:hypothetical protein